MTVQHLLNFSSGLFYPPITGTAMPSPYAAPHSKEDPHADFLTTLQVCHFFLIKSKQIYNSVNKGNYPGIPVKFEPGTDCTYYLWIRRYY